MVFLDGNAVMNGTVDVIAHLERIPAAHVTKMQTSIKRHFSKLIYSLSTENDAFERIINVAWSRTRNITTVDYSGT